ESIKLPSFPDEPAVQHIYAAVYIPEEYALTSYKGNCSKNFQTVPGGDKNRIATINTPDIDEIMRNMQQGMSQQASWRDYPVDGVPYLFSAVQPDTDYSELGKFVTLKMRKTSCINAFLFAVLLAGGIVLIRYNWRVRGIAVFGVIAVYALLAFVAPTLMYVVGVMTGVRWAIILVVLAWLIWSFLTGWDCFKKIMTTPILPKKQQSQTEVKAEIMPEMTASNDQPQSENTEGGNHA
ncbi:MAG: hypothetical protein FWD31_12520, partial [Planctomycetaceae bacterium]|nr:hypothetical protein [Planctomycetaceae bacterium]